MGGCLGYGITLHSNTAWGLKCVDHDFELAGFEVNAAGLEYWLTKGYSCNTDQAKPNKRMKKVSLVQRATTKRHRVGVHEARGTAGLRMKGDEGKHESVVRV